MLLWIYNCTDTHSVCQAWHEPGSLSINLCLPFTLSVHCQGARPLYLYTAASLNSLHSLSPALYLSPLSTSLSLYRAAVFTTPCIFYNLSLLIYLSTSLCLCVRTQRLICVHYTLYIMNSYLPFSTYLPPLCLCVCSHRPICVHYTLYILNLLSTSLYLSTPTIPMLKLTPHYIVTIVDFIMWCQI